ncbi:hypothetical protein AX14_000380 [Amanita brunnescens Koide BX004]|nr:hypothetical protein AX14_000380 [Amanita brunnescens Koide BX004]
MPTTGEFFHDHNTSFPESQVVTTGPEAPPAPLHTSHQTSVVTTIFTFGIRAYHASLAAIARDTELDLKAAVPVWEAVQHFDTILLATIVTASFKESIQVNPVCWFFITSSLLQASMALVYSTILIIMFSGGHNEYTYSAVNEDQLHFLGWSVWDHFSLPAISTVWSILMLMVHRSILMLMVALTANAVWPGAARNNHSGQHHLEAYFMVAKAMSFFVLCFTAARFDIFLFQLHRISQALYQAARAESA